MTWQRHSHNGRTCCACSGIHWVWEGEVFAENSGVASRWSLVPRLRHFLAAMGLTPLESIQPVIHFQLIFKKLYPTYYLGHFNKFLIHWLFTAECYLTSQISPLLCQSIILPVASICLINTSTGCCFIKVLAVQEAEFPLC